MFEQLDYVYMPSRDVAADVAYFTETLGARLVFAIDAMGTRVAMVELTEGPPRVLLAGHLHGETPVLVYRVADLERATAELRAHGWTGEHALEIPQGPVRSFVAPGGQRLGIYERTAARGGGIVRRPAGLLAAFRSGTVNLSGASTIFSCRSARLSGAKGRPR